MHMTTALAIQFPCIKILAKPMMHKKIKISVQTERTAHKNVQTFTVLYHREFLKDAMCIPGTYL